MKKSTIAIILLSLAIIAVGVWAAFSNKTYLFKGATTNDPFEAIAWGAYCTSNFPEIEPLSCTDAIVNCQEKMDVNTYEFLQDEDNKNEICMILELDLYCEEVIQTETPEENTICQNAVNQCLRTRNLNNLSDLDLSINTIGSFYNCVIEPINEQRVSNDYCLANIYPNQENVHPNLLEQCRIRYSACGERTEEDTNAFNSCMECVYEFVEVITPSEEQLNQCTRAYESCLDDKQREETDNECLLRRFPEIQDEDRFGENLDAANVCRELLGSAANDNALLTACIAGHNLCAANQEEGADQNMCTLCIASGLLHNIPPDESDAALCNQASLSCQEELGREHTDQEMETCLVRQMNTLEPRLYPERFSEVALQYCEGYRNDEKPMCQRAYTECRGPEGDFYRDDMEECVSGKVQQQKQAAEENALTQAAGNYCRSILAAYPDDEETMNVCIESYLQN